MNSDFVALSALGWGLNSRGGDRTPPGVAPGRTSPRCKRHLRKLDALVRDLRHEQSVAAPALADWIIHLELEGKRPKTLYEYVRAVAPLLRAHPDKPFAEFTHLDINDQLRLIPPRSRHISRSIYNGWFTWGYEQELIPKNPMLKVAKIRAPKNQPADIFTEAERHQLEALPAPDGPLWALLFGTGLRRGEARRLRRGNIDLDRGQLMVINGKGGKDRAVGIPDSVAHAIADLDLVEPMSAEDHLWYIRTYEPGNPRRRRDPIGDTTFERWYRRSLKQAGVRYLRPHQTRHTYGYWLRDQGNLTLQERALLMGHEDIRMTQRYDRITIADLASKMAAL
jgi:integrase